MRAGAGGGSAHRVEESRAQRRHLSSYDAFTRRSGGDGGVATPDGRDAASASDASRRGYASRRRYGAPGSRPRVAPAARRARSSGGRHSRNARRDDSSTQASRRSSSQWCSSRYAACGRTTGSYRRRYWRKFFPAFDITRRRPRSGVSTLRTRPEPVLGQTTGRVDAASRRVDDAATGGLSR